jgi:putative copper export protein
VLSPSLATIRLFLHVLAATVWVGGQLTLAGLLPVLRTLSPEAPRAVARQFNRIAWPAFGVLVLTGGWSLSAVNVSDQSSSYTVTVFLHLMLGAVSAMLAALHAGTKNRALIAASGAAGGLVALLALFVGVMLRSASS